jgi:glycosyltransferase involved in cell wall biosynthesis
VTDANPEATRIAVVVTCFDSGSTLRETLASFREAEPLELVVVDDGSERLETLRVLEEIRSGGVRVIRQDNRGLSSALMTGVRATTSPYVMRFDSDDIALPGALGQLADGLDRNPNAAAAWGDLETFGLARARIPSVPRLDPWHLTHTNGLPASAMFRREALLGVGGWELRRGYEDWDVWMSLAERGAHGVYVERVAYRYRRTGSGLMSVSLSSFDEHYRELRERHRRLFAERRRNRRLSRAPRILKLFLPVVERLPFVTRLRKVQLAQALTVLLWNGGPGAVLQMTNGARDARRATQRRDSATPST